MSLFWFPEDRSRREAWVRAIRQENIVVNKYTRICQVHFTSGRPSRYPNQPDYVLTRFNHKSTSVAREDRNVAHYERLQVGRRKQSWYFYENCGENDEAVSGSQHLPGGLETEEPSRW